MNLKESFRYQNFLNGMIIEAGTSLTTTSHCLTTTKTHLRNQVSNEVSDMEEAVDVGEFPANAVCCVLRHQSASKRARTTSSMPRVTRRPTTMTLRS